MKHLTLALITFAGGVAALAHHDRPTLASNTHVAPGVLVTAPHPSRAMQRHRLVAPHHAPAVRRARWHRRHDWTGVARCESSGRWHIDTGNGFYGGLQFTLSTWRAFGGHGHPQDATRAEQEHVAERVLTGQGVGAWPVCGRYLTVAAR